MKLNAEQHGKGREVEIASGLERGRRSPLARARSQLSQAVGDVLSGFEGKRQGGGWLNAFGALGTSTSTPHAERLREVVIRDRALFAANPRPRRTLRDDDVSVPSDHDAEAATNPASAGAASHVARTETDAALNDEEGAHDEDAPVVAAARAERGETANAPARTSARTPRKVEADETTLLSATTDEAPVVATPLEELAAKATKTKASASKEAAVKPRREPIRTRTMARLLASQGHRGRALSIYDDLLAADANDASLRAEAEALRGQSE